jgi:hypothetical protein
MITKVTRAINPRELAQELASASTPMSSMFTEKELCPHVGRDESTNEIVISTIRKADPEQPNGLKTKSYTIAGQTITLSYVENHCQLCGKSTEAGHMSTDMKEFKISPADFAAVADLISDILPFEYQSRVVVNKSKEIPSLEGVHSHNVTRMLFQKYLSKIQAFWVNPDVAKIASTKNPTEAIIVDVAMDAEIIQSPIGTVGTAMTTNDMIYRAGGITPSTLPGINIGNMGVNLDAKNNLAGQSFVANSTTPSTGAPSRAK